MNAPRSKRVEVNGWVILDKPIGMTSTHAVARLKHIFNGKKAGHAGTLDPLASGILPVAFGEATKTVPYVQDGEKAYRFTIGFGIETDTDDSDGRVTQQSELRPQPSEVAALLPRFIGTIEQTPPAYSAIKINGERAYDLARDGETPDLAPRPVTIHALDLVSMDGDSAVLEARCGKGTYVRAIARDLGRLLGCYGHVTALRRTRVGPFLESDAIGLTPLLEGAAERYGLLPIEAGLAELPRLAVDRNAAAKVRRGQSILLRGHDIPHEGSVYLVCSNVIVAVGTIEQGEFVPHRVFNLPI